MSVKISVIVAVYQAEKYIMRCLDSLLLQTFDDFELILVDDGSKDKSGLICDQYAEKDNRVRVIHKENEGVSKTRQTGLDVAQGEYIIYTDPDDWVEKNYLKDLYEKAISEDADMTICDFWGEYPKRSIYFDQKPSVCNARTTLEEFFPKHNGCTWNKLVKRKLYSKYNVRFPDDIYFCEDLYVNCCLLVHDIKIAHVPKALYHYDQIVNSNSLVKYYSETTYKHDMKVYELFAELFNDIDEPADMRKTFARNLTERAFWGGRYNSKEFKEKFGIFTNSLKEEKDVKGKLYYLSSRGYYSMAYKIAICSQKAKRTLLK